MLRAARVPHRGAAASLLEVLLAKHHSRGCPFEGQPSGRGTLPSPTAAACCCGGADAAATELMLRAARVPPRGAAADHGVLACSAAATELRRSRCCEGAEQTSSVALILRVASLGRDALNEEPASFPPRVDLNNGRSPQS